MDRIYPPSRYTFLLPIIPTNNRSDSASERIYRYHILSHRSLGFWAQLIRRNKSAHVSIQTCDGGIKVTCISIDSNRTSCTNFIALVCAFHCSITSTISFGFDTPGPTISTWTFNANSNNPCVALIQSYAASLVIAIGNFRHVAISITFIDRHTDVSIINAV